MAKTKKTKKTKKTQKVTKSNPVLVAILLIVLAISIGLLWYVNSQDVDKTRKVEQKPIETIQEKELPSPEEAELTGFEFMQDFSKLTTEDDNDELREKIYETLSEDAKEKVSMDTFLEDILSFVDVEKVPEQGTSVENIKVICEETAEFFSGMNYLDGRILRKVTLVLENEEWKVDGVEEYQKEDYEDEYTPAIEEVITFVMEETEVEKKDLILVSTTEQEWPDGCLGLGEEDEMCTMALVPGYEIVLEVKEEKRIFRTDMEGTTIREEF